MTQNPLLFLQKVTGFRVFLAALLVRLLVFFRLPDATYLLAAEGDMKFYNDWALRILDGVGTNGMAFYGLPGYSYLLAGVYAIFGEQTWLILLGQVLVEAFVAYLIYEFAKLSFQRAKTLDLAILVGMVAAFGYVFFLPAQAYSSVLMPSCLQVAAFWSVVWWCARERKEPIHGRATLILGVAMGAMSTLAPAVLSAAPLVLYRLIRQKSAPWANSLLLFLGIVLGCSPVLYHNRVVVDDAWILSAHGGVNFFIGNHAESTGFLVIPPGLRANQAQMLADSIAVAEKAVGTSPLPRSQVSEWWSSQAKAYIRENPLSWLRLLGQKIVNFFNIYEYDDLSIIEDLRENGILLPGLRFGWVAALGLAGIVISLRSEFLKSRWILAAILLQVLSILSVFVTERYRLTAIPGLLIFAAFFLVSTGLNLREKNWRTVFFAMIVCAATAVFVNLPVPNDGALAASNYNRGLRQLKQNNLGAAETLLLQAWEYAPKNENTNFALGNLYLTRGDFESAKKYYRATLASHPEHPGVWNNLAQIALEQNMADTAIEFLEKSLSYDPGQVRTLYLLAQAWLKKGDPRKATDVLAQAKASDPQNEQLLILEKEIRGTLEAP